MLSITATELPRLLACNGSRNLEGFESSIESDDTGRKEGDAAHWLIEQAFKSGLPVEALLNQQAPNGMFITADMIDHVTPYLNDIRAAGGMVEYDTSFTDAGGKWQIRGRADHIVQSGGALVVSNLKYGWRIVEPEMNYTEIWHIVGFLLRAKAAGIQYLPTQLSVVEVRIYQPRPYHSKGPVRFWRIQRGHLMDIWDKMEKILENPDDMLNTGPHCYKCSKMFSKDGLCPAIVKAQNSAIDVSEQAFTDTLNNKDLSQQLKITGRAVEVLKQVHDAYEDLAKHRIGKGQIVPDFAIERSMGNREWKPNVTPDSLKMITGRDLTNQKLMTPNQVEKLGVPKEVVASLTAREPKGINLVRASADEMANKMFNNQKE